MLEDMMMHGTDCDCGLGSKAEIKISKAVTTISRYTLAGTLRPTMKHPTLAGHAGKTVSFLIRSSVRRHGAHD